MERNERGRSGLRHVALLGIQRKLHEFPPGRGRFDRYLAEMTGGKDGLVLPLSAFNPMGKAHVAEVLDALIALDAEAIAAEAVAEAAREFGGDLPDSNVGLVLADDRGGGWTNRYAMELERRLRPDSLSKWGWIAALLWTSEPATAEAVRSAVRSDLFLVAEGRRAGPPKTVGDLLRREGRAAAFAGCSGLVLSAEDLEYSREVLRSYRDVDANDPMIAIPCLFGDEAGRSLGYPPIGLSPMAGIAVARSDREIPESLAYVGIGIGQRSSDSLAKSVEGPEPVA